MLTIGHRFCAGYEPENTIRALRRAIAFGVQAVECDVRKTKDNRIVVLHGPGCTGPKKTYAVHDLTYKKLRTYSRKNVPLLKEVLKFLSATNKKAHAKTLLNIELKEEGIWKSVLRLIKKYDYVDAVIVSAFNGLENKPGDTSRWEDLLEMRKSEPNIRIAFLVRRRTGFKRALTVVHAFSFPVYAVCPSIRSITPSLIKTAHALGLKVFVWTVNYAILAYALEKIGVDGIFSDYPGRIY